MAIAMAVLGVRRAVRRPDPDPGRRRTCSSTSSRATFEDSPLFHIVPSTAAAWLGLLIGGVICDRRDRRSPTTATSPARGVTARLIERLPAPARLPAQQVVLRRAPGRARLPAGDRRRAVRQLGLRAGRRRRDRQRRGRRRPRRRGGRPRGAVGLRARLRAAAGRRLRRARRLLPGGEQLMLNVLLWAPLAAGVLSWSRRARRPAGSPSRARWSTLGLAIGLVARLRLRRRRASSTSSTSPGSPTSASATSSASTGSASSWSC